MASAFLRELSLWADFNSLDDDGRIRTSLRFAGSLALPAEGEWIRLEDDEGNSVMGVVEVIRDLVVHVRPEMSTWRSEQISFKDPLPGPRFFRAALPQGMRAPVKS